MSISSSVSQKRKSASYPPQQSIYKYVVVSKGSPHLTFAKEVLSEEIKEFYNYKKNALEKIEVARDRKCEMLLYKNLPVGVIVYKRQNENERFVIKHLTVIDKDNIGRGYRSMLFRRILKIAQGQSAKNIFVKLNLSDKYSIDFFTHKGFSAMSEKVNEIYQNFTLNIQENEHRQAEREASSSRGSKRSREEEPSTREEEALTKEFSREEKKTRQAHLDTSIPRFVPNAHLRGFMGYRRDEYPIQGASFQQSYSVNRASKQHSMTLRREYIHQIRDGRKTIEGRIRSGIFLSYRVGDKIRFYYQQNPQDDVVCEILDIKNFKSFDEMLFHYGYKNCLAEVNSLEQAVSVYNRISGYRERAQNNGVLAIQMKSLGISSEIR